ncbi:MAG: hypothetical protein Tsb009_04980 [Planctomycetaceae bacterium]
MNFSRYDDQTGLHRIIEANGGGVALLDYDGNGILDIFLTNGCKLPLTTNDRTHPSALFAGREGLRYQDVTQPSGMLPFGYATGCTVGDYNSDGFDDIYVSAFGKNSLWRNNGDGTFTDVTAESGTGVGGWGSSTAFADFNRDGVLDLYVVNYVQASDNPPKLCPDPKAPDGYLQCTPTVFRAAEDVLFLGNGHGGFVNVTRPAGITGVDGKGLGVVVFDANGDRWPDIYVANDGMPNHLYLNETGTLPNSSKTSSSKPFVRFREAAKLNGLSVNYEGAAESGMGIAAGDVDGDGWTDLFVTHFFAETNTFYRNLAGSGFSDETNGSGLGPPSRPMVGFGTMFLDFDNNGRLDLFVGNGHVDDFSFQKKGEAYQMLPQMFRNTGRGKFEDVSWFSGDYFRRKWIARGVATGDLDNDGDIDIVISHQRSPSVVLRNDTPSRQRSVVLQLVGRGRSSRTAFGARVEANVGDAHIVRELYGGTSFHSAPDRRIHIGLERNPAITSLKIRWPSGESQLLQNVKPGYYVAIEGQKLRSVVQPK